MEPSLHPLMVAIHFILVYVEYQVIVLPSMVYTNIDQPWKCFHLINLGSWGVGESLLRLLAGGAYCCIFAFSLCFFSFFILDLGISLPYLDPSLVLLLLFFNE